MTAEYRLVAEFGGSWNDEHAYNLVGNDLLVSARYLRDVGGVDLDPSVIVERLLDEVVVAARREMPWRPGARELLAECTAAGVPCAMVTMSYTRFADALVDVLPAGTFATVVTGDQVSAGKPDPEAYRTACERLGVSASESVAIEDSPTGLASAEAAGCVTVAVPHHVPIPDVPGRTRVQSMTELTVDVLDSLVRRRVRA
jgi:HAD superfamily hydrolase (TIGR01509 family)